MHKSYEHLLTNQHKHNNTQVIQQLKTKYEDFHKQSITHTKHIRKSYENLHTNIIQTTIHNIIQQHTQIIRKLSTRIQTQYTNYTHTYTHHMKTYKHK